MSAGTINWGSRPLDFYTGIAPRQPVRELLRRLTRKPVSLRNFDHVQVRHTSRVVSARLPASEYDQLDQLAKANGIPVGTYVGQVLRDHLKQVSPGDTPEQE